MNFDDPSPFEVLILGELIVRKDGAAVSDLPRALAETLTLLAAHCSPVPAQEVMAAHADRPSRDAFLQHITRLKRDFGLPVVSDGPRGRTRYQLDPIGCRVDAAEFVRGVTAGDVDDLLRLWRGAPPASVMSSPAVMQARTSLIKRISALPAEAQAALADLPRFAALFPDDQELDKIRLSGPRSQPRLLIVEDNEEMMGEMCGRLESRYRLTPLSDIGKWRLFRKDRSGIDLIQGALIDLSLTVSGDDQKGLEVVRYLHDNTEIPVALVTANTMESTQFGQLERMNEYRLVDIVNKQSKDWFNALEDTAELLVGNGVTERRRRMETWLNAAHRNLRRETSDAPPGSVAAARRQRCDDAYAKVVGLVKVGDVDDAQKAVGRFCTTWRASS